MSMSAAGGFVTAHCAALAKKYNAAVAKKKTRGVFSVLEIKELTDRRKNYSVQEVAEWWNNAHPDRPVGESTVRKYWKVHKDSNFKKYYATAQRGRTEALTPTEKDELIATMRTLRGAAKGFDAKYIASLAQGLVMRYRPAILERGALKLGTPWAIAFLRANNLQPLCRTTNRTVTAAEVPYFCRVLIFAVFLFKNS
jgi:hypothetical protein